MRAWPLLGILFIQVFLCFAHWFLFFTWMHAGWPMGPAATAALGVALAVLAFCFPVAALLGFRWESAPVVLLYRLASVWLGLLNFLFWGACLFWLADGLLRLAPDDLHLRVRPFIALALLVTSAFVTFCGLINARIIRLRRVTVALP
ncbi:MAG TPA: hypothetical protein VFU68_03190, partial [Terracidiphilus sp.]|nr:hypothetical protein [Terracidiphilus sp.]